MDDLSYKEKHSKTVNNLLKEIVQKEQIGDIVKTTIKSASENYDKYIMDNKLAVSIVTNLGKTLNLSVKCATNVESVRKSVPVRFAYCREVFFYETILPAFQALQGRYKVQKPFKTVAKYYGNSLEDGFEMVILEDITKRGYKVLQTDKTMDKTHIGLVLREYARFHALSFALKDQCPLEFQKLIEDTNIIQGIIAEAYGKNACEVLLERATKIFDEVEDCDLLKRFRKYNETFVENYFPGKIRNRDQSTVISHTDCNMTNMMFKYNDPKWTDTPIELMHLDFQLYSAASPIFDISWFIFSCGSKETFDNMPYFLNIYYNTLSSQIVELGSDVNKLYPRKTFQAEWQKYSNSGIGAVVAYFGIKHSNREVNLERVKPVVKYFYENNLI